MRDGYMTTDSNHRYLNKRTTELTTERRGSVETHEPWGARQCTGIFFCGQRHPGGKFKNPGGILFFDEKDPPRGEIKEFMLRGRKGWGGAVSTGGWKYSARPLAFKFQGSLQQL